MFSISSRHYISTVLALPVQINLTIAQACWVWSPCKPIVLNLTDSSKCLLVLLVAGTEARSTVWKFRVLLLQICFFLWPVRMKSGYLVINNLYRKLWDAWESQGLRQPHGGCAIRQCPADLWKQWRICPVVCWLVPVLQKQAGKECGSGDSKPQHTLLLKQYKSPTGSYN